jgi:hypothetical protein
MDIATQVRRRRRTKGRARPAPRPGLAAAAAGGSTTTHSPDVRQCRDCDDSPRDQGPAARPISNATGPCQVPSCRPRQWPFGPGPLPRDATVSSRPPRTARAAAHLEGPPRTDSPRSIGLRRVGSGRVLSNARRCTIAHARVRNGDGPRDDRPDQLGSSRGRAPGPEAGTARSGDAVLREAFRVASGHADPPHGHRRATVSADQAATAPGPDSSKASTYAVVSRGDEWPGRTRDPADGNQPRRPRGARPAGTRRWRLRARRNGQVRVESLRTAEEARVFSRGRGGGGSAPR